MQDTKQALQEELDKLREQIAKLARSLFERLPGTRSYTELARQAVGEQVAQRGTAVASEHDLRDGLAGELAHGANGALLIHHQGIDGGQIDAISGATVTSRGVSLAVTEAAKVYEALKPQIAEQLKGFTK